LSYGGLINTYLSNSREACVDAINKLKSISFKLVLAVNNSSSEFSGAKFSTFLPDDLPKIHDLIKLNFGMFYSTSDKSIGNALHNAK
jgi:hypothetical protein